MKHPYALPSRLPPVPARTLAYWKGLLRGGADMPFWDDAKLSDLPDIADRLFLIDVFDRPQRFRLAILGQALAHEPLEGRFLDEVQLSPPLDFLASQCCAAVEAAAPTFLRAAKTGAAPGYGRLVLPMWGEGRVGMLLGAVDLD